MINNVVLVGRLTKDLTYVTPLVVQLLRPLHLL